MPIDIAKIEALAPDQASLNAAKSLLKSAKWPSLATDGESLAWGECQGSGSSPYRTVICEADGGYKCTCPSRKFPCKHSLALMWLRAEGKIAFAIDARPAWVEDWLARRRGPSAPKQSDAGRPKASAAAASSDADEPPRDPKAAERAAAARDRTAREREETIARGLGEFDTWLLDALDKGLASFVASIADECRTMARRLVDAKAPALATALDALPSRVLAFHDAQRTIVAARELARLHLIAAAYRAADRLDPSLRADARAAVGWTVHREQVLDDPSARRIAGSWRVVAARRTTQPDKLVRQEIWLLGGKADDAPVWALLLDFIPAAVSGGRAPYVPGERFDAELAFFPGTAPLRALIARQDGAAARSDDPLPLPSPSLLEAYSGYERSLAAFPWLEGAPLRFSSARVATSAGRAWIASPDGRFALPFDGTQELPFGLSMLDSLSGAGYWDGYAFRLWWAETPIGPWRAP
jgi:hypothetical protein